MKPKRTNWQEKYHLEVIRRMALEGQLMAIQKQMKQIRTQLEAWKL